jgi:hypothetical protein
MTSIDSTTPVVDQALLPASLRNASDERKKAYQSALSFESTLVGQLTESMMKTTSIESGDKDSDGTDIGSGDAATSAMKQQLPGIMRDALMGVGGIGLAAQLDSSLYADDGVKKTSLSGDAPADTTATGAASASGTQTSGGGATA